MFKYFLLIPILKKMFKTPNLFESMRWHQDNKSRDGLVQHAIDSKAWAHIDTMWLEFEANLRNLKLGLALDGVNPFGNQSTTWSIWPVMILNYNVLPWLTTKKLFLMLVLLIPRK